MKIYYKMNKKINKKKIYDNLKKYIKYYINAMNNFCTAETQLNTLDTYI